MRIFYDVLLYLIQPILLIRSFWKNRKISSYWNRWKERYGFYKNKIVPSNGIVFHAVSVGETLAVIPLIHRIRYYFPNLPITITSTTSSGFEQVKKCFGDGVYRIYFPYDLPYVINRFLLHLKPKLIILLETELWPNLIRMSYYKKISLIIINARISKSSFNKLKKLNFFIQNMMKKITLVIAKSREDGRRFLDLGLDKKKLFITKNLKFDIPNKNSLVEQAKIIKNSFLSNRLVWIAGSTYEREEKHILTVHKKLLTFFPNLLLILVPRHPERSLQIKKIIDKKGFNFSYLREMKSLTNRTQILFVDSIGKLRELYGMADLAFIGGSLIRKGGHNPLEAAMYSIPILAGIHTTNFKDIYEKLKENGGLITLTNISSMFNEIFLLLKNKQYRKEIGKNAVKTLEQNEGSTEFLFSILEPYFKKNGKND